MKSKLNLNRVRKSLNFKVQDLSLHNLGKLAENAYGYFIDFDVYLPTKKKNLQRDFVWTLEQKQEFIISVLKEIKIAPLAIIQHEDENKVRTLKIIDGKQRLSTLIAFYKGEFPIVVDNEEYYYEDLDDDSKREIHLFKFKTDIAYEYWDDLIPDDEKIKWFEMLNFFGTPQDIAHLNYLKS